jgi:hypothetical protein
LKLSIDRADQPQLFDQLVASAAMRANEVLSAAGSDLPIRQPGPDELGEIRRLESSPMADDQFVAVALRLARSRMLRGQMEDRLTSYFKMPASSLEIEAQRRTIWRAARDEPLPLARARQAVAAIERDLLERQLDASSGLSRWAALYADLWCDPRIGASAEARRQMLAMVSILHARSQTLAHGAPRTSTNSA